MMDIQKQKTSVALLSVVSNSILVILKLVTGLLTGSVSVLSEAVHSSMDLIASVIAFFAVRISARRPDAEHPFGHGKVEDISALAEALLIVIAAVWIVVEAISKIISPQPLETLDWGIAVMLLSVVANIIVSHLLFKVGKKADSPALIADAWHLRTDVWTSAGVLAGLSIIWVGARLWPEVNLSWIDPVAAMMVAMLILRASITLTIGAIKDLIDTSPPAHELYWLSGYLESWYPTVRSIHRIRTRKSGAARFIDLHIVVDPAMTVSDSHAITEKMTSAVREKLSGADLTVHIEPCDGLCKKSCVSGCMLPADERRRIQQAAAGAVKKGRQTV
ncbi:MAG: cation diffusion facilitator family transporter [Chloroflexi bacterium]|nr:cation diffusion facilitator family transporter [Chloroflexota bacterium]